MLVGLQNPGKAMSSNTQHPIASHEQIPPYVTGIYIVGPSSSGKTTLCHALAARLALPSGRHVTEVARSVMKSSTFTREHVGTIDMQRAIMNAQITAESEARTRHTIETTSHLQNQVFLLCDRSAIDPIVYAALSASESTSAEILAESAELQKLLPTYRRALFVLLHPVKEWIEDDGVRSLDDPISYPDVYKKYLERFGIKFQEMGGNLRDLDERVNEVLRWAHTTRN